MSRAPRIVVAGYGRWIKAERNPAAQIAELLKTESVAGCELTSVVIPVSSVELPDHVCSILREERPDYWLGLGVNTAGTVIQPEMIGINWRHFSVADVDGAQPECRPIFSGGPDAYNSGLPNREIVQALCTEGIPAQVSFHAGTHLCNQMLYSVNHLSRTLDMPIRSGFIHVPQTPENVADAEDEERTCGSMSLAMMAQAIRIAIGVICDGFTPSTSKAA
ncbi:pyroglutamyl-peptidase I family protein [Ruegeria jejuensis]|uniref:pyroglutamyl-peptidase I family protein n=1 Tax=Ruegeria jejuensis TaxID=3233338 RepID=UPI00355B710E